MKNGQAWTSFIQQRGESRSSNYKSFDLCSTRFWLETATQLTAQIPQCLEPIGSFDAINVLTAIEVCKLHLEQMAWKWCGEIGCLLEVEREGVQS